MSANSPNPGSGSGSSGISISEIVDRVVERIFSRLVTGILIIGGSLAGAILSVGDALQEGLLDPIAFVGGSLGSVGDSIIRVFVSIDLALLQLAESGGIAAPILLVLIYGILGLSIVIGGSMILSLIRSVIPIL